MNTLKKYIAVSAIALGQALSPGIAAAEDYASLVSQILNQIGGMQVKKQTKPPKQLPKGCKYVYEHLSEGVSVRKTICEELKTPEFHTKNTQSE